MTKFLSKWLRKIRRWIAVPTALAIPAAVVIKLVGNPEMVDWWEKGTTFAAHFAVMLILLTAYRQVVAPDSLMAMTIRISVWVTILLLLLIQRRQSSIQINRPTA